MAPSCHPAKVHCSPQPFWHDTAKAPQVGPALPPGAVLVQAGGGHARPVFFAASRTASVWRLNDAHSQWDLMTFAALDY